MYSVHRKQESIADTQNEPAVQGTPLGDVCRLELEFSEEGVEDESAGVAGPSPSSPTSLEQTVFMCRQPLFKRQPLLPASGFAARELPRSKVAAATTVLLCFFGALVASALSAESVLLALNDDGETALADPAPLRSTFVSPSFFLAYEEGVLEPRTGAGATRTTDGRVLAAIEPIDEPWGLFELDPVARRVTRLTVLEGSLSSLAADDEGHLFGVTFKPARLVRIDETDGSFTAIGPVLHDQGATASFKSSWSSLWFEAERGRLLYLFANHDDAPIGAAALNPDTGVSTPLTHELSLSHRAEQMVVLDGQLRVLSGAAWTGLEVGEDHIEHGGNFFSVSTSTLYGNRSLAPEILAIDVAPDLLCVPSRTALCLGPDRGYRVTLDWHDPFENEVKPARALVQSDESGMFWFVEPSNIEAQVKVLDACGVNGHRWVFGSASSDLAFTLRVTEMATGLERTYTSPPATAADAITDASAFPCGS